MRLPAGIIAALYIAGLHPASAINGGDDARVGDFPYMASVRRTQHLCGAIFINSRQLLSAASCVDDNLASALSIRSGSLQQSSGGKLTGLADIHIHPDYNQDTLQNDIAILNLVEPVDDVTPATLPTSSAAPAPGSQVSIAGWGSINPGSKIPSFLKRASLPVVDIETCRAQYKGVATIFADQFCIGVVSGGKGSCEGDEGGPIVQGNTLVGILSSKTACGLAGYSDIDIIVGAHLDWIKSNLINE